MNMKKTVLSTSIILAMGGISTSVHAALVTGSLLTIEAGSNFTIGNPPAGLVFGANLSSGTQGGLIIGQAQGIDPAHPSHPGSPHSSQGRLDQEWEIGGSSGQSFTTTGPTVLTDSGATKTLDFSGWTLDWNAGIPHMNLGGGFQDCGTTTDGICLRPPGVGPAFRDVGGTFDNGTGIATITCSTSSCSNSSTYTLTYTAIVPQADPSNFGGATYNLTLTGHVSSVPVPAAAWLFGSGLLGLVGIARRKHAKAV